MELEPWHIPLLVTTAVILPPSVWGFVRWLRQGTADRQPVSTPSPNTPRRESWRVRILGALTLALGVIVAFVIGQPTVSLITTAASAVSTVVSAALTFQSYMTLQEIKKQGPPPDAPS